tara:strand:+ start:7567 stop:8004 length:438 start_codon:yes stop_codon:yes gene_type:complete
MSDELLHTGLYSLLTTDAPLVAIVGTRLYSSGAENQSSEEVYIVFDEISSRDEKSHDGDTETPVSTFEFKIYAPTPILRLRASDALLDALRGAEKTTNGSLLYFSSITREYLYDATAEVTRENGGKRKLFRRLANFRIQWQDRRV